MSAILAIDAGTTGVRTVAIDVSGVPIAMAYREFPQHFPQPGWVEHDPDEVWQATLATLAEVAARIHSLGRHVLAIGITNQRETTVVWDKRTGHPRARAIVWQDRRTAPRCVALRADGIEAEVRNRTGLVLDPYFSATKLEWLLNNGVTADDDLAFGTIDSWIVWNLSGGTAHQTDTTNASRTMLFDINTLAWSPTLCAQFGVPMSCLPQVRPSSGYFATTDPRRAAGLDVPIAGIAGDQQAALFGQACFERGMAKNTYGTGSFVLVNVGTNAPPPVDGLLTTVAWTLGGETTYAMEGSVFVTGAAIQWLRDGLGVIAESGESSLIAARTPSTEGVYFVPAFTGLGSPWWDPYARGSILGITRGTTRDHVVRAAVDAMAYQTRDVVDAIVATTGAALFELRVDGGASKNDVLLQYQADLLGVTVRRPIVNETTAQGAAFLAGLGVGLWPTAADAAAAWTEDAEFHPGATPWPVVEGRYERWRRAIEVTRAFGAD